MDVVLLRWPADDDRRAQLQGAGRARLLLVEGSAPPPALLDELEDWIRLPAAEADLEARIEALAARAPRSAAPTIDDDGLVRFEGRWVSLPPVEARLAEALIGRYGAVVSREALSRAGWPQGAPGRNALDVHVLRLRRRVAPLDLVIRTVRNRGYLLERTVTEAASG
ncbi:MAG: winged helix-turn-helix domain-containing protein [Acidimicrobiia bacterium]